MSLAWLFVKKRRCESHQLQVGSKGDSMLPWGWHWSWFPRAAVVSSHRWNGLKERDLFFHGSEDQSPKSGCQQGPAPSGSRDRTSHLFRLPEAPVSRDLQSHPCNLCACLLGLPSVPLPSLPGTLVTGCRASLGNPGRPSLRPLTTSAKTLLPSKVTVTGAP